MKCKVDFCHKEARAKGWCFNHYIQMYKSGRIGKPYSVAPKTRYCSVKGCKELYWAKEMCRNHYCMFRNRGTTERLKGTINKGKQCKSPNCSREAKSKEYCVLHYWRLKNGYPLESPIGYKDYKCKRMLTKNPNPYWKKGQKRFPYPNHYQMKQMRKLKIKNLKGKCECCGGKGQRLFHKDLDRSNHDYDNLLFLCNKCFYKKWRAIGYHNTTKKYHTTLTQISKILNKPMYEVYYLHRQNKLKRFEYATH